MKHSKVEYALIHSDCIDWIINNNKYSRFTKCVYLWQYLYTVSYPQS